MQRPTTKLRTVASDVEQMSLIPDEKFVSKPVVLDRIYALKSTFEALEYACELARTPDGRPIVPKQIYPRIGVDKGVWSRILSGEYDLDGRDILPFCRAVNNDAYYQYIGYTLAYDLTSFRKAATNDLEQEVQDLRDDNAALRRALHHVLEKQSGKG